MGTFQSEYAKIKQQYNSGDHLAKLETLKNFLKGRHIVIFGASFVGDMFWDGLTALGFNPECFVDNFNTSATPAGRNNIIKPTALRESYPNAIIIIAVDNAKDAVFEQLIMLGYKQEEILKYPVDILAQFSLESFEPYLLGYEWAYNFFPDDISKSIVMQKIYLLLMGGSIDKSNCSQYFESGVINLTDDEVFVDCGFFTGDTVDDFTEQTNGLYRHIYAFEPDRFVIGKANMSTVNLTLECKAVSDRSGVLKMRKIDESHLPGSSHISEFGTESIEVTTLDSYFETVADVPTFVKMDIEGAELDALHGAEGIIREHKPKLAICVYHKPEDIYKIPQFVSSIRSDYKFSLRHYGHFFWETVMYAF